MKMQRQRRMLPSLQDLKSLIEEQDTPCVSLYLPLHGGAPHENLVRLKNLLHQAEQKLASRTCPSEAADSLRPTSEVLHAALRSEPEARGIAAFASRGVHRDFRVPLDLSELVSIGRCFYVRPLLPLFDDRHPFHILALSQKQVRLFEADRFEAREVRIEGLPSDLGEMLRSQSFEKELQFHAMAAGSGKGGIVYHGGRNEPKDRLKEYLREVAGALFDNRSSALELLVLASVEYIASIYRTVNRHPNLVDGIVAGNPDLLSARELHAKAWEIVQPHFAAKRKRALGQYSELASTNLVSQDVWEIVAAARNGRVRTLFIATGVQHCDASGEDLLNWAASQTLLDGGVVHEIPSAEMPDQAEIAALFRY